MGEDDETEYTETVRPEQLLARDPVPCDNADCSGLFLWLLVGCRTDFADIQNKKECGGNRQWQRQFLRKWAANTKGKAII